MRFPLLFVLAALLLPGCVSSSTPTPPPDSPEGEALYDSLQAANSRLRSQLRSVRDSLTLYDDIDSGSFARELRALRDQITRMSFELSALRDGGQTVSTLRADSLFEPASATLTDAGRDRLKPVAAQLRQTYPGRSFRVEGHSDTTPLSPELQERFPTNWELSAARASAVVRVLSEFSRLADDQFVAVAFGSTQPVTSNETELGRARNRRVRVSVLPTPRDYSRPFETSW